MIGEGSLTLRPAEERDHPLIHRWQNESEVWWWMDYERPFSLQDIADAEARSRAEGHPFIIEVEGRPIRKIGLNQFRRRDRICSLYIYIAPTPRVGSPWTQRSTIVPSRTAPSSIA